MVVDNSQNANLSVYKTDTNVEHETLNFLRALIDNVDSAILAILTHRAQIVNYILEYKIVHNLATSELSNARKSSIDELLKFSSGLQLDRKFVKHLLQFLFHASETFVKPVRHAKLHSYFLEKKGMLQQLNRTLKHLDMSFCSLLSERMQLIRQVGEFKKAYNIKPLAKVRWEQVLKTKIKAARRMHINPDAIAQLYDIIHEEALRIESDLWLD